MPEGNSARRPSGTICDGRHGEDESGATDQSGYQEDGKHPERLPAPKTRVDRTDEVQDILKHSRKEGLSKTKRMLRNGYILCGFRFWLPMVTETIVIFGFVLQEVGAQESDGRSPSRQQCGHQCQT